MVPGEQEKQSFGSPGPKEYWEGWRVRVAAAGPVRAGCQHQ